MQIKQPNYDLKKCELPFKGQRYCLAMIQVIIIHRIRYHIVISYLLPVPDTTGTLLTMTTSKFIPYLGCLHCSYSDFTELIPLLVNGDHNLAKKYTHHFNHLILFHILKFKHLDGHKCFVFSYTWL